MNKALIDTDILSMFLRGHKKVKIKFKEYLSYFSTISISILSYYEILSGLKYKNARNQLEAFLHLCEIIEIIPITVESTQKSAEIFATLKKNGRLIDDVDILIAGICLENNYDLITNNFKHFSRIKTLEISNWSL